MLVLLTSSGRTIRPMLALVASEEQRSPTAVQSFPMELGLQRGHALAAVLG